jgi:hypothetical protein
MRVHLSVYVLQHVYQRLGTRMSSRQPRWKRKSGYHSLCLCSGVTLWLDHSCDTRQRSSVPFALRLLFFFAVLPRTDATARRQPGFL